MSLTPEQLMIPRVMCIGTEVGTPNYPGSHFKSGDVLKKDCRDYWSENPSCFWIPEKSVERFPHLFRDMPWYEGRTEEEMPKYLKHGENGKARKVNRYYPWPVITVEFEGGRCRHLNEKWIPATEAEYIAYQNLIK